MAFPEIIETLRQGFYAGAGQLHRVVAPATAACRHRQVLGGDVETANPGGLRVDGDQLAVIAPVQVPEQSQHARQQWPRIASPAVGLEQPGQRVVDSHLDPGGAEPLRQDLATLQRADAVDHHPHPHTAGRRRPESIDEAASQVVELEDVELEIDAALRRRDGVQQPVEEGLAVHVELGALPVRGLAGR